MKLLTPDARMQQREGTPLRERMQQVRPRATADVRRALDLHHRPRRTSPAALSRTVEERRFQRRVKRTKRFGLLAAVAELLEGANTVKRILTLFALFIVST